MSHIIIHIGTHGTEARKVQSIFAKNRAILKANNIIYPDIGDGLDHDGLAHILIDNPGENSKNPAAIWEQYVCSKAGSDQTVIISSYEFSRMQPSLIDMKKLRAIISAFDKVTVICVIRNQADVLQSIYQENSKTKYPGSWGEIFPYAVHHKLVDGFSMDFGILYDHLLAGFKPSEISFLSYESEMRQNGGIAPGILNHLGLNGIELEDSCPDETHPVDPLVWFLANQLAAPDHASENLYKLVRKCCEETYKSEKPTTILSKVEHQKMSEVFEILNRKFEKRISDIQPDLKVSPMLDNQDLSYRGVLGKNFWLNMSVHLVKLRRKGV